MESQPTGDKQYRFYVPDASWPERAELLRVLSEYEANSLKGEIKYWDEARTNTSTISAHSVVVEATNIVVSVKTDIFSTYKTRLAIAQEEMAKTDGNASDSAQTPQKAFRDLQNNPPLLKVGLRSSNDLTADSHFELLELFEFRYSSTQ